MKHLYLLSAIAMACGAAHAQSSVTLYGVVDVNVQRFNAGGVGKSTQVGNGALSTGRIGFRGVEDLGGGLSAGFWLEGSINADSGEGRNTNTNNQPNGATSSPPGTVGFKFDRIAHVSLANRFGQLRLGHDFIPTHWNSIYFDPFNANGVARAGNLTFAGVTSAPLPSGITASNSISYWLPAKTLGGVYGMAMVATGENLDSSANPDDGNLAGFRLGYASGPFDAAVAMTRTKNVSTATIGDYTHANVGGTWNVGFAKFFALYNVVKVDLAAGQVRKNTAEIGAHIPVGPGVIRVSYAALDDRSGNTLRNADGSARKSNDARQIGVGYVHNLSKRTAVYTSYARLKNRGQATYTVSGNRAPLGGHTSTGVEAGIRHSF